MAYCIQHQGPLGYWSQQGVEASHKITKLVYSRMTQRDGGRGDPDERATSMLQMMQRAGRVLVGKIRVAVLYSPGAEALSRRPEIMSRVAFSEAELDLRRRCLDNMEKRIRRKFLPDRKRRDRRVFVQVDDAWIEAGEDAAGPLVAEVQLPVVNGAAVLTEATYAEV